MEANKSKMGPPVKNAIEDLLGSLNPITILQFVSATRDEDRVSIVYNALSHLRPFDVDALRRAKSAAASASHREDARAAEDARPRPSPVDALRCYTKSIANAPYPTCGTGVATELALVFGDRSAVLFAMAKYEECLSDIEQALKFNYPERLKYNLCARKGDCLQIMGRTNEAKTCFEEAATLLPLATELSDIDRKKKLCYIRVQLARIDKGYPRDEVYRPKRLRPEPQVAGGASSTVPAMSSGVEIAQSAEWGRHVRATRDILPGEVLIVEKPYASIVWSSNYLTHCYNCFRRFDALIPCKTCPLAMYCSESCRENSWNQFHSTECPLLFLLNQVENYQFLLTPLRIILVTTQRHNGLRGLHDHVQKIETTENQIPGFNSDHKYVSSEYTTLHHLVTNADKLTVQKLWPYALNAALIVKCLESHGPLKADLCDATLKRFVGGLLLRYEMMVASNGYPIDEYSTVVELNQAPKNKGIGGAMYPTSSLINHSCDANTCGYQRGDRVIVTATLPIAKGEQVFIDYVGQRLSVQASSSTRRSFLQEQFHFTCGCRLCMHGMPHEEMKDLLLYWQCHKCRAKLSAKAHPSRGSHVTCHRCKERNAIERLKADAEGRLAEFKGLARRARSSCDVTRELGQMIATMCEGDKDGPPQQLVQIFKNMLRMNCTQAGNYFLDD